MTSSSGTLRGALPPGSETEGYVSVKTVGLFRSAVARLRDRIVAHRLVDRVWRAPSKFGGRNELSSETAHNPEVTGVGDQGRSKVTMPTQNDHIAEIFSRLPEYP